MPYFIFEPRLVVLIVRCALQRCRVEVVVTDRRDEKRRSFPIGKTRALIRLLWTSCGWVNQSMFNAALSEFENYLRPCMVPDWTINWPRFPLAITTTTTRPNPSPTTPTISIVGSGEYFSAWFTEFAALLPHWLGIFLQNNTRVWLVASPLSPLHVAKIPALCMPR